MEERESHGPQDLHLVVLPFSSEGHVNGMLKLAQALACVELKKQEMEIKVVVTFGFPARFHHLARRRNNPILVHHSSTNSANKKLRIEVVPDGLPLDETHLLPLPERLHISETFYRNSVKLFLADLALKCKPNSSSSSTSGLSGSGSLPPLSCIVSDTFLPWTQDLANDMGLPRVDFWTSTAAVYSMGTQLPRLISNGILPLPKSCWVDPEKKWKVEGPLIDGVPGLPPFPATDMPVQFVYPEELTEPCLKFMRKAFGRAREAHTIFVHSAYELESQVIDALQADGFRIHCVGPFLDCPSSGQPMGMANQECIRWLDTQPPNSVVYVALGSIASLIPAEMHALALGLEASGCPFLWVIRRDSIASSSLSDVLPEGFLQRTAEKGVAHIIPWAPQTEVLHHGSVGAFFSHCGWNSTMESMWEGVPMVACPQAAEQRSNARWIVERWKIGGEVERRHDGSFSKEAVQGALEKVLITEVTYYKQRALETKEMIQSAVQKGGTSNTTLVSFLNGLLHH